MCRFLRIGTQLFWVLGSMESSPPLNFHGNPWLTAKLRGKYRYFHIPCPHTGITFCIIDTPPQPLQHSGTFVTIDEFIERSWSLKVHSLLYGLRWVYIPWFGQMYNDMTCSHNYTVIQSIPTASKSSVLHLLILPFPQLLTTIDIFTVSTVLAFSRMSAVKIIQYALHIVFRHFVLSAFKFPFDLSWLDGSFLFSVGNTSVWVYPFVYHSRAEGYWLLLSLGSYE